MNHDNYYNRKQSFFIFLLVSKVVFSHYANFTTSGGGIVGKSGGEGGPSLTFYTVHKITSSVLFLPN